MLELILNGLLIGAGATLAMDIWALLLNLIFGSPLPSWANVGRWFWHLGKGKVFHKDITKAAPFAQELSLGWLMHYAVGMVYGAVFLVILGPAWLDAPGFLPAWVFSIITVGAGWFLLHPGMGLGWAGSKTPQPWKTRMLNLLAHTAFALGLWGTAVIVF